MQDFCLESHGELAGWQAGWQIRWPASHAGCSSKSSGSTGRRLRWNPIKNKENPIKNQENPIKNKENPIKNKENPIKNKENPIYPSYVL